MRGISGPLGGSRVLELPHSIVICACEVAAAGCVHRSTGFWARTVADAAPLISVVVPAHDAGQFLHECIDALMASDLPRSGWELIVVDDASTDETAEIALRADRMISVSGRAHGPAYARNRGAEEAR